MNPWRFLPWILCVWVQLVICSLEDDEQASKRYESRRSDSPFLWSVGVELVNDNTLRFDWMNLTSATAEVQHFELNAYTERDLWGVQYTKTINSTARVGYLGDLLPGRNYEIVFAAMYADRRSFVDAGMQSTPTQDPTHSNWTVDVVTVNQSTLQFEWSPPLSGVDEILHIEMKATTTIDGREANFKNVFGPTARKGFLGGLLPGRTYDTLLVVEYSNRSTEMYTGRHSTKPPSPSTVRNFRTGVVTPCSIGLMWDPPLQPDGYLDWYVLNVQYENTDGSNVEALKYIQPELTAYVIDQLPADREIRVEIQSNTKSTLSNEENLADQWSETIRVRTLAATYEVHNLAAEAVNSSAIRLTWDPPFDPHADILNYLINLQFTVTNDSESNVSHQFPPGEYTQVIGELPADSEITVKARIISRSRMQPTEGIAGKWSKVLRAKTYAVLSAPLNFTGKAINSTAIQVSWRPPHNTGRKIDHYKLFVWYHAIDFGFDIRYIIIEPLSNDCVVNDLPPATGILVSISAVVRLEDEDGMTEDGMSTEMIDVTTPPEGTKDPKERLHPKRTSRHRCQTVHVGGQQSTEVAVESGVLQGSVLGPTLFIIYVNDCVSELDCGIAMFADEIKLWSVIRTAHDEEHLQANLNRLQQWSKDWLLPFNEKKCNILRVGRARSPNHMAYCLHGIPLQEVDSQKDLGVWITTSLKPSLHCTKIAKSAMSVLYLVKRTFSAFDEDCFAKVFRTFVRPQLEFAIQAWRPWTAKDISILERVQRRATKLVAGQGSLPYATRLTNLDLFPLSYRQLRGDLIQTFRIIRGQDCSLVPGDFFELATTTNLRGHQFKLRVTGARLDTRKFFFSNRVIEAWNALPVDVVMSASVEVFKRKLDLCSSVH
ncbi:hypothetical protein SprV_0602138300 [Sparganum proliferum]